MLHQNVWSDTSAMYGAWHVLNFLKVSRSGSMTDLELDVDDAIVKWCQTSSTGDYFDHRPWTQLYEEQKQIVAQLFWQEMLS